MMFSFTNEFWDILGHVIFSMISILLEAVQRGVALNAVFQELEMAGQVMEEGHEEACRNFIQPLTTPDAWEVRNNSHIG